MHLCVFIYLENTLYLESFDERAETLHMTLDVGAGLLFPAHVAPGHLQKHKLFQNQLSIGLYQVRQDWQNCRAALAGWNVWRKADNKVKLQLIVNP